MFNLDQVSAIIAKDHYSEVICGEERSLADDSLDSLESRLDPARFFRIHRGSIININFLKQMRRDGDRKYTAILSDVPGSELPISRENIDKLKAKLSI